MCCKLTSVVMEKDPFHASCLPVHIGTLAELNKANELFFLINWWIYSLVILCLVECYYLMVGHKNECATRYLSKATTFEKIYGSAWTAYGHSFVVESEHDQAVTAYFTEAQLVKGCRLPNGEWKTAEKWFLNALEKIKAIGNEVTVDKWEPSLNNLGLYVKALDYHRQALVLIPQNAYTYSAIRYIHSLLGNFENAVDCFHIALGLRQDDMFFVTMLGHCIEMYIGDSEAYIGADIKDKLKCYDFDVHAVKTLKNIISPPWDFRELEVEKQDCRRNGVCAIGNLKENS
ncbi:LOW QUALITY PROTEIN: Cell division cycle protein 16-like protein [Plecturocebus cupreus]